MTIHRVRRLSLVVAGILLLLPVLLWVGVLLVAPTPWAKGRVIAALEARTGRSVRLESLAVAPLGGVRLNKLEIGSPGDVDDPWLKAATIRVDMGLARLMLGNSEPTAVEIDGVNLRVLRRADGSFELADFLLPDAEPANGAPSHHGERTVKFHVRAETISLIDEPSLTRLCLRNVDSEGIREGRRVVIHHMRGTLNGGPLRFAGELDRGSSTRAVAGRLQVEDVVLDDGMSVLRYAVPVLAGASLHLKGQLDADIDFAGQGATWDELVQSLHGKGVIAIDPIDLDGAPLVGELSKVAELSRQGRMASIRTDFVIKDKRIATDHFTLNIGTVPMTLSGWTDFDGKLDYKINLAGLDKRLPGDARRILGELNVNLGRLDMLSLQGTMSRMVVQLNGLSLDRDFMKEVKIKKEDRDKLRVLGRQLLDRISR
jgi:hypothetical protein